MNKEFLKGLCTGILGMLTVFCTMIMIYTMKSGEMPFHLLFDNGVSNQLPTVSGGAITFQKKDKEVGAGSIVSKMYLLQKYIDKYYINDTTETDYVSGIYKGMIASLGDVYSNYYSEEEYQALKESSEGNYEGIGAVVQRNAETGETTIVTVYEDSPAEKAGLQENDKIYKVAGHLVAGEDLSKVVSWMKGKEGTKVDMVIYRENRPIELEVERQKIEIKTVAYEMLKNQIGYIQVASFEEATVGQFHKAVTDLENQGMKGLIIDLRNNGGGVMKSSIHMLNRILPKGVLVSTKDKEGKEVFYHSDDKEKLDVPLVVLINQNSASASEIFAGAIKDRKAGTLVGMKSFGKGIVQTVFGIGDGSALKLTTSEYFTPSGQNIHKKGIEPDIEIEFPEEILNKPYITRKDDVQLKRAVEEIKKKL